MRTLNVGGTIGATPALINTITCKTITVNGSKSVDIPHPTPPQKEQAYRLRNCCTEGSRPDSCYRMSVTMTHSTQTFDLPEYFDDLTSDPIALVLPYKHFGSGWAEFDGNKITVHVTTLGVWHLQIIALRADPGHEEWDGRVEYIPESDEILPPDNKPPAQSP